MLISVFVSVNSTVRVVSPWNCCYCTVYEEVYPGAKPKIHVWAWPWPGAQAKVGAGGWPWPCPGLACGWLGAGAGSHLSNLPKFSTHFSGGSGWLVKMASFRQYWHLRDYYGDLQIEPSASKSEIKKAYRRLALQWHPDKVNQLFFDLKFRPSPILYSVRPHIALPSLFPLTFFWLTLAWSAPCLSILPFCHG